MVPAVLLLFFVGACERRPVSGQRDRTPVVADVDGTTLTQREFEYFLPENYQQVLTSEEVRGYLDRWITTQLLYDEALVARRGANQDVEFRVAQYRRDLIADQRVQQVIEQKARVSEGEVRAWYDARADQYQKEYRVSHILVNTREDAEKVKSELDKRSFEYLARRYSIDKHARYGGDLQYLSKGNMIPEFDEVIFDMKVGDISDIIESEFGYHIVKLTEIREARFKLEYEDVKNEIANNLTLEKRTAVYDSLVAALWEQAHVTVMDDALRWAAEAPPDTLSGNP